MSSDSESDGQLDSRAAVAVREDDTEKDSADVGGNDRILEQGPPTYEEALTLFKRDTGSSRSNSSGDRGSRATRGAGANGRRSSSRDYEMAERLQREELARARAGRNASLAHAGRRSDGRRWSSPGGNAAQSQGSRRGAIPENEEIVIIDESTPPPPAQGSNSGSSSTGLCCYSSWFGFTTFTRRLPPVLRRAWRLGLQHITKTALPVFSTQWRYTLFSLQALVTVACIILSFASTPLAGENLVRSLSLLVCVILNFTERMVSWCGCCGSKKDTYNAYSDITRNFLTDICLYPAVLASIMNALNTQSYNVVVSLWDESTYNVSKADEVMRDDAINFSLNLLVVLLYVVMVHFLRLWQLGGIVRSVLREFKKNVSGARSTARAFIVVFFVHVLVQSIVQTLYLFLIGYRMQREVNDSYAVEPQILGVSVYLFIMMVCGELVPLVGIFTYFITTQKWAEEFSIAFLLDHSSSEQSDMPSEEERAQLERHFKSLHGFNMQCSGCLVGVVQPLVSPLQVAVEITFFALWALFVSTYLVRSLGSTSGLELSLVESSHGLYGFIGSVSVYGLVVLLSLFSNIIPLAHGLLGLALLPFWVILYIILGCSTLCKTKS